MPDPAHVFEGQDHVLLWNSMEVLCCNLSIRAELSNFGVSAKPGPWTLDWTHWTGVWTEIWTFFFDTIGYLLEILTLLYK